MLGLNPGAGLDGFAVGVLLLLLAVKRFSNANGIILDIGSAQAGREQVFPVHLEIIIVVVVENVLVLVLRVLRGFRRRP